MKYSKYLIVVLFLFVVLPCIAEEKEKVDHFEGVWGNYPGYGKIESFLMIEKIGNQYLIIRIAIGYDGDPSVSRGFGKRESSVELKVELRNTKYTIRWDSSENGEWLAMYFTPKDEGYPTYRRVETFSLDKF